MQPIVIVGSSGHAKVVIDVVEREGRYRIAGLIDRFRPPGETTLGHPVLGGDDDLPILVERHRLAGVIVAIGDNFLRLQVAAQLDARCGGALPFITAVHPSAAIGRDVALGVGTVVMAGVAINSGSRVGRHCLLNTHASLDHDSTMDDGSSLAPRATTGGHCRLGEAVAIGIGACLAHRVSVGAHTVIGAGSTVLRPIGPGCVAYGTPARPVRQRLPGAPYL